MINKYYHAIFATVFFISFQCYALQTSSVDLPVALTVTNAQCSINNGSGLPANVELPIITTDGNAVNGSQSVFIPLLIDCSKNGVSRFAISFSGNNGNVVNTTISNLNLIFNWIKTNTPVDLSKVHNINTTSFQISNGVYDASMKVTLKPTSKIIAAGSYTAVLYLNFSYY